MKLRRQAEGEVNRLRQIGGLLCGMLMLAGATPAAEPDWPEAISIATGSSGGTYDLYGEGLAKLLSRDLGIRVTVIPSDGPSENIELLESGAAQVAFVTLGVARQAWEGTGEWSGVTPRRAMRAIFPMYDTPFHFVVLKEAGAASLADLGGKRIGIGPEGGSSETYTPALLEKLGIAAEFATGTWEELTAQLRDGALDGLAVAAGVPLPAISQLEAENRVRYLPLSPDQVLALRLAFPELNASQIPAGTYPSLLFGYDTVGLYNFAVVSPDLPASLVYEIVDTVFDRHEEMIEVHPAAASTLPRNFVHNTFLPYHAGAVRYYGNISAPGVYLSD
jgi:TRAP transporter TAXI family solute receptor